RTSMIWRHPSPASRSRWSFPRCAYAFAAAVKTLKSNCASGVVQRTVHRAFLRSEERDVLLTLPSSTPAWGALVSMVVSREFPDCLGQRDRDDPLGIRARCITTHLA